MKFLYPSQPTLKQNLVGRIMSCTYFYFWELAQKVVHVLWTNTILVHYQRSA